MTQDALEPDMRGIDAATASDWRKLEGGGYAPRDAEYVAVRDLPRLLARAIAADRKVRQCA